MSRTLKDRPSKVRFPEHEHYGLDTEKTKKRKSDDTEWHWMSTPSWWTHMCMTKPERRANSIRERAALFNELSTLDFPDLGRRPHIYYW